MVSITTRMGSEFDVVVTIGLEDKKNVTKPVRDIVNLSLINSFILRNLYYKAFNISFLKSQIQYRNIIFKYQNLKLYWIGTPANTEQEADGHVFVVCCRVYHQLVPALGCLRFCMLYIGYSLLEIVRLNLS